jgi:hypothetical protein
MVFFHQWLKALSHARMGIQPTPAGKPVSMRPLLSCTHECANLPEEHIAHAS